MYGAIVWMIPFVVSYGDVHFVESVVVFGVVGKEWNHRDLEGNM